MRIARGRPTASLFVQLLTLTLLTLVAAEVISLLLIFNLPPPTPDFYRLTEISQAFKHANVTFAERRPLELLVTDHLEGVPAESRNAPALRTEIAKQLGVPPSQVVIAIDRNPFSDRRVMRTLRDRLVREGVREEHFLVAPFEVAVKRPDGRWNVVRPQPAFGLNPWQQRIALWFVLSALAMAPVSYIFARRLSAPIRLFAEAAERLGRDPRAPTLHLRGSAEISTAVRAFNDMQERLKRYVEDRTAMVGAIAHDLRTPLTRLRFRIEALPDDQRLKIAADIDQMEAMISAALTFVRDASIPGERTPLELSSLLESLCDEMSETGAATEVETGEKVVLEGDPMALRRLFSNLLDNAVKFGGRARARVFRENAHAVVEIEDDGPGIPNQDRERVFEPFYRREPSRNRQTGGAGLGLAIVRSIARGHGGDVALFNRRDGGLTARVQLPL
ncbi:ATP-binding protein [Phenylobacterium soli]|uniref:histidine kinase n=1 Tax=Phenylobacterium soli TaxID=2170551 RepID=A0A328AM81_9CAUL|nr:ATP-binding protein [Phenylobacterium soli]RAK55531.1 two-component sensor histidine kinase [Phenylobacterium soli]